MENQNSRPHASENVHRMKCWLIGKWMFGDDAVTDERILDGLMKFVRSYDHMIGDPPYKMTLER